MTELRATSGQRRAGRSSFESDEQPASAADPLHIIAAPRHLSAELARVTGLSPSATSRHLARMREEGLIASTARRSRILYFIKTTRLHQLISTLKTLYCP